MTRPGKPIIFSAPEVRALTFTVAQRNIDA